MKNCTIGPSEDGEWKCESKTSNTDGVCDSCKAAGWTVDPKEIAESIASDPELSESLRIRSEFDK